MNTTKAKSLAAILTLLLPSTIIAQTDRNPINVPSDRDDPGNWSFDITAGIGNEPTYAGSDEYETEPEGNIRAIYQTDKGDRYTIGLGELEALYNLSENWVVRLKVEYEEGRDSADDPILKDLTPVRSTVEGEFLIAYRQKNRYIFANFQPDLLGRGKGMVYFLGAGMEFATDDNKWTLDTTIDVSWGNGEYMMTEFGISQADSDRSGLRAYTPGSGMKSVTLDLLGQRRLNERWSLLAGVSIERYASKAYESPLLKDHGSKTTHEAQLGVMYRF